MKKRDITLVTILLLLVGLSGCGGERSSTSPQYYERLRYVAMGASDAVGIGAFPLTNGYVYQVRDGLLQQARDVDLFNLGVSGKRISYIEDTELPEAIRLQPDVITIWAGPNDVTHGTEVSQFEADLYSVLSQLRSQTSALVVIANIPDMTVLPRFILDPDADVTVARVNAFNRVIAEQAAQFAIPVIDLYSAGYASQWEYVSLDGFHPSNDGHKKLADLFLDIIWLYL